ncbi:complement C1q tumor necrosis factor-related protein 3-like [Palaemon carinicauda]|uniref:complement C1q tumor necrosis factor-related protein 3-like n=1 Tax=Palaemon carinicauda TaxID=392227 RepID=UPI0035B695B7
MKVNVCLAVIVCAVLGIRAQNQTSEIVIAFSVRKAATINNQFKLQASPYNVQFRELLTNVGGGWIPTTGEFIAPKAGVYFFTFSVMSAKTNEATVALMKDGDYQVTAFINAGYNMATNSAVLTLKEGDSVYLILQDGEIYENPLYESYTTLSGYLIGRK